MAQHFSRLPQYCPRCGTPTVENMRFCAKCGLPADAMLVRPSDAQPAQDFSSPAPAPSGSPAQPAQGYQSGPESSPGTPFRSSGPASSAGINSGQGGPMSLPGNSGQSNPMSSPGMNYRQSGPASLPEANWRPSPASMPGLQTERADGNAGPQRPPAPAPGRGRKRAGILLILLAVLLVLGVASYVVANVLGVHLPGTGGAQPPITATTINETVPYAGVDITIVKAEQAASFVDDPHTASDGMVRLSLQEQNKGNVAATLDYVNGARLLLPGRAVVLPTYVKGGGSIAMGAMQTSVLDFAVPGGNKVSQLVLRLGKPNEAQMDIPLTGNANLSQYQPKTELLNGQMVYFGLNWTLTGITTSLSIDGRQAPAGMRYLVATVKIDSTLSQTAITGPSYDYARLKYGSTLVGPQNSTVPVSFDAGATGQTGTLTFLVPQNSSSFTFILLSQDPGTSGQAATAFQVA